MKSNLLHALSAGNVCAAAILFGVCSAPAADIFVTTFGSQTVNEVNPGGHVVTVVSGLNYPDAVAFNSAGDLFIANTALNAGGGDIIKVTRGGVQTVFASDVDPAAIAFDSAGNLFTADYSSGNIYEFSPDGTQTTFASGFSFPNALAFDRAGNLFVGSGYGAGNGVITEITPGGDQSTIAGGLNFPRSFAFNSAGDLFEADAGSGNIYEFTPSGSQSIFASVSDVGGMAFDNAGNLIVVGSGGSSIIAVVKISPRGKQKVLATFPGNPSGLAIASPKPSLFARTAKNSQPSH